MLKTIRNWFKGIDAFELGAIIFIFVGIFLVGVAVFLGVLTNIKITGGDNWYNITQYSEFIAGMIGGVWSLAGVLLFYSSLSSQKADLEAQKDLLVKQIDEVVAQTKEFRIQNEMSKEQKNEETFFQLLRFHNEIIDSIQIEQNEIDFASGENITKTVNGRRAFVEYYDIYKRFFGEQSESYQNDSEEELIKVFDKSYNQFYLEYQADLGHYFRNLFNLVYFIDTQKESQKEFFLNLMMAQLSNFELTLLFFHCLRKNNSDFKELVEKYEILAQVPKDEVTSMAYSLYDPKAFGADGFGSGEIIQDEMGQIDDLDNDSLLSQISVHADDLMEGKKSEKKSGGLGLMEDLLSRIDNIPKDANKIAKVETTPSEEVEGEDESLDFLEQFFDNSNKVYSSSNESNNDSSEIKESETKKNSEDDLPDLSSFFDNDSAEVTEVENETNPLLSNKDIAVTEGKLSSESKDEIPDLSNFFDDDETDQEVVQTNNQEEVIETEEDDDVDVPDLSNFFDDDETDQEVVRTSNQEEENTTKENVSNSVPKKKIKINPKTSEKTVEGKGFLSKL